MNVSDRVPARRVDAAGKVHVDQRAILALALPLMANSAVQLVLNLTDVWFIGRISTRALAAVSAVHWLAFVVLLVLSGLGMAVQTVVAQAHGARRQARAAQAVWIALWGLLLSTPLFLAVGLSIRWMLAPFGLPADIVDLAAAFWLPRVGGSCFGAGVWALLGFFNGIGRTRVTLVVTAVMAVANAIFNPIFIFQLHLGVAGSGLATMVAQACGLVIAVAAFLRGHYRRGYRTHLTWTPNLRRIWAQWRIGFPMGLLMAADLIGFSVFQLMQVKLGEVEGAASQIVMIMTAIAYLPGIGIALAGTTLVGQSIGAGDRDWAYVLGNRVILVSSLYMGGVGVLLAACGPWLLPLFMAAPGASSAAVISLGVQLLWIASAYQFFDGLNLSSGLCLRGAGDAKVPAAVVFAISWLIFVPLAHMLTFAPGQGWVDFLPQWGFGAVGGWVSVVIYSMLIGLALLARWRSRAWQLLTL
ncbi:MAG TPA: MATE family efflux transporter [Steroidobacteraceae bacterium]|nr:MATE family efflux transporter [Steroidobacteraceae bacterium]